MRRVVAASAALWAAMAARASALPLTNADLEPPYLPVSSSLATITGSIATGWQDNSEWADVTVGYAPDTTDPHHGTTCQRVDVTAVRKGMVQLIHHVNLTGGQAYSATVWLRGTSGMRVSVILRSAVAPYNDFGSKPAVLTGAWQPVTAKALSPTDAQALLMVRTSDPGSFCVDDVAVSEVAGTVVVRPYAGIIPARYFGLHAANFQFEGAPNPGFEAPYHAATRYNSAVTGLVADGWFDDSDWSNVAVDYEPDPAMPHGGASSQRVTVSRVTSGAAILMQRLRLPAGGTYRGRVWLRGAPGQTVRILLTEDASPWTVYAVKDVQLTADWQQASVEAQVPTYQFTFAIESAHTGTFWVDDAELSGEPAPLAADLPPARFGLLRLWESGVTWSALEPQKGVWDFSLLDRLVDLATARGIPIMLTLGQSPTWASARPGDVNSFGAGAPAEPANLADWRDYVATVASRYAGRIRYYEVWNEPNDSGYYTGSVETLVALTREARLALDGADAHAQLISPAAYTPGWLDSFLDDGGGAYVDIVGYHFYETPPEALLASIPIIRLILEDHGIDKPFWNTEGAAGDQKISDGLAAAYVARSFLVNLIAGNEQFNWFYWGRDTTFCANMVQSDLVTPTPAGAALDEIRDWLVGAQILEAAQLTDGTWRVALTDATGAPAWIVWNPQASVQFPLPAAWHVRVRTDLSRAQSDVTGAASIAVDGTPILLDANQCLDAPPCAAADACHDPGVCDPTSGVCSSPARIDGAPCPDGSCQSGVCRPVPLKRGCTCSAGQVAATPSLFWLLAIGLFAQRLYHRR